MFYLEFRLPLPLKWTELGFTEHEANQIAHRFCLKLLLENRFNTGLKDKVTITLERNGKNIEIVVLEKWLNNIFVPLDLLSLEQAPDKAEYFTRLISEALKFAANTFNKDTTTIDMVTTELLQQREDCKILLPTKNATVAGYLIQPYVKVKGRFTQNTQLYLAVTEPESGRKEDWLLIEAHTREVMSIIGSFAIENDWLIAKHDANDYSFALKQRGYRFPLKVQLSRIFR